MKHGYPPDLAKMEADRVIDQSELLHYLQNTLQNQYDDGEELAYKAFKSFK